MKPYRLDELVLVPASEEQWIRTHELQLSTWGGGLSDEQFKARERHLRFNTEFGRSTLSRWALVPRDDPSTLDFASACESYCRPAVFKSSDGQVTEGSCETVVSVFTEEAKRGNGYAQRMTTLLHDDFSKRVPVSVLYSDVGDFYARSKRVHADPNKAKGWKIVSPMSIVWPVDELETKLADTDVLSSRVLDEADLAGVCKRDAMLVKEAVDASKGPAFAVLPTVDQLHWLIARCKFIDSVPHPPSRKDMGRIKKWGVEMGSPDDGEGWSFAIWSFELNKGEMQILRLRCHNPQQLQAIVKAAENVAEEYGMKEISAWNVNERLLAGTGWKSVERKSSLPAMAWYGEDEEPAWLFNEHYAWG